MEATVLGKVIGERERWYEIKTCRIMFVNFKSNGKCPSLTDGDFIGDTVKKIYR